MVLELIDKITNELILLGFNDKNVNSQPPIVNRINITINMAKLALLDNHKLTQYDKKWCEFYAQYVHMFDSDEMEKLGELYYELIESIKKEVY